MAGNTLVAITITIVAATITMAIISVMIPITTITLLIISFMILITTITLLIISLMIPIISRASETATDTRKIVTRTLSQHKTGINTCLK